MKCCSSARHAVNSVWKQINKRDFSHAGFLVVFVTACLFIYPCGLHRNDTHCEQNMKVTAFFFPLWSSDPPHLVLVTSQRPPSASFYLDRWAYQLLTKRDRIFEAGLVWLHAILRLQSNLKKKIAEFPTKRNLNVSIDPIELLTTKYPFTRRTF